MDDLISRQHAIDNMAMVIWGYPNEIYPLLNDMDMALQLAKDGLMGVPSAQQWIPCSERLPEHGETVIVTRDDGAVKIATFAVGEIENGWQMDSWYTEDNVKAWMPLPEPYKEENDG